MTEIGNLFKFNNLEYNPSGQSSPLVDEEPLASKTDNDRAKVGFSGTDNKETQEMNNRRDNISMCDSAKQGHVSDVKRHIKNGADPNFVDPESGSCAIHFAAAISSHELVELLQKHPDFDPLVLDKNGFYASDLAIGDAQLADKLFQREKFTARFSRRKYRGHVIL